ncbi:hypothetical protein SPRG_06439 [Saprolegnia parasitica CBS 223.65]|uniref:Uncharacterized protein n=1 Tax=Saprolegnia parasitica (strain CBS 223.65) TaxID=695850 RepID=A0A067CDK8_SAPPC|nr:hypothetical protein SPRG_06439 [Saprolegnia parasitica CBS 223.65]KDO28583.1 hypothetical protein SPRG_06439 [Saprolegnia parasitica CBS 223.65]|eukprot:XP_012200646.1 hypothetical protein SPRG_06439 [Saprolegnia parasitica CBS 223.65]
MSATFRSVILGQPEIAAIVFGYQAGLYEDVRPAFRACEELVEFDTCQKLYLCDASLYKTLAPSGRAGPTRFGSSRYLLRNDSRDDRLPLHLAIASGCVHLATRIIQCRPDLASEDAILLAFIKDQLETVEVLLDLRATLPALESLSTTHVASVQEESMCRFPVGFLVDLLARGDTKGLKLLQRFGTGPDDFEGRHDAQSNLTMSERVVRWAMPCATLANVALALELFPWFHSPGLLDDVASKGFLSLVRLLHGRRLKCSTNAMDKAAANGHLEVVGFLHSARGEGCTVRAMTDAAANGHLEVVRFLHFNRTEGCTTRALDGAICNGHLAIARFLIEHRSEGASLNILDEAAGNGHLEIVQYLHNLGSFGCTVGAVDKAAAGGHFDVVQFLLNNRSEGCSRADVVTRALTNGHLQTAKSLLYLGYPFPTSEIRWYVNTLRKPEMMDVVQLLLEKGGSLDASCILYACSANHLPLVRFLHERPCDFSGLYLIATAMKRKAWDVTAFLLAHGKTDVLLLALGCALPITLLDLVMRRLERQPELRDDKLLQVALRSDNVEAMRGLLTLGIGKPRECLVEIAGRPMHVTASKLLLPYCMDATKHLDNILYLLDLLALPNRRRKTTLQLITSDLLDQGRKASQTIQLAPSVAVRASTLLEAGKVVDWALALVICQRWTSDAPAAIEQLEKPASLVQDAELQTQLYHLLAHRS